MLLSELRSVPWVWHLENNVPISERRRESVKSQGLHVFLLSQAENLKTLKLRHGPLQSSFVQTVCIKVPRVHAASILTVVLCILRRFLLLVIIKLLLHQIEKSSVCVVGCSWNLLHHCVCVQHCCSATRGRSATVYIISHKLCLVLMKLKCLITECHFFHIVFMCFADFTSSRRGSLKRWALQQLVN